MNQRTNDYPSWPSFDQEERDAVMEVLVSGRVNYWAGGRGQALERVIAEACEAKHAVVMANGSVTLDAIIAALDIGQGDQVIVTPRSFIASASCIALAGATPIFADVDPVSQNITVETVQAKLTPKTKGIIAVHHAGWPCDMVGLRRLADDYSLALIEDCAQAHGAKLNGRPVGGLGDAASFSFCQDKIVTLGGEGGVVVTSSEEIWERVWSYKDHGKNYGKCKSQDHPPGFRWLHETLGTNLRMTEMQAAIGLRQFEKLPDWSETRRRHAAFLNNAFRDLPGLRVTEPTPDIEHAYYKYYVFVRSERLKDGWDRDRIMAEINANDIPCMTGGCPELYLEGAMVGLPTGASLAERLPVAKRLGEESLMLQVHPTLTPAHIERVADTITAVMRDATAG